LRVAEIAAAVVWQCSDAAAFVIGHAFAAVFGEGQELQRSLKD
jgi:hypothetical protein